MCDLYDKALTQHLIAAITHGIYSRRLDCDDMSGVSLLSQEAWTYLARLFGFLGVFESTDTSLFSTF